MIDSNVAKSLQEVLVQSILTERARQDDKWGVQDHNHLKWLAILMEEVGEASELVNEFCPAIPTQIPSITYIRQLREELIQIAAVALAWCECVDRKG